MKKKKSCFLFPVYELIVCLHSYYQMILAFRLDSSEAMAWFKAFVAAGYAPSANILALLLRAFAATGDTDGAELHLQSIATEYRLVHTPAVHFAMAEAFTRRALAISIKSAGKADSKTDEVLAALNKALEWIERAHRLDPAPMAVPRPLTGDLLRLCRQVCITYLVSVSISGEIISVRTRQDLTFFFFSLFFFFF